MYTTGQLDKIHIAGMQFYAYHGVFPEERRLGQQFNVDVTFYLDLAEASAGDRLEATVNYAEASERIKEIVEGPPFQLLEALAGTIASGLLQTYKQVREIEVKVTKPHPPIPIPMAGVSVEIRRKRDGTV